MQQIIESVCGNKEELTFYTSITVWPDDEVWAISVKWTCWRNADSYLRLGPAHSRFFEADDPRPSVARTALSTQVGLVHRNASMYAELGSTAMNSRGKGRPREYSQYLRMGIEGKQCGIVVPSPFDSPTWCHSSHLWYKGALFTTVADQMMSTGPQHSRCSVYILRRRPHSAVSGSMLISKMIRTLGTTLLTALDGRQD